ncbi:hypothetical protein F2Q69_00039499 [Brassica cretica]|uniref:AB hydrolase-1 domain-containing protein n=1 Tax=Brassica cretica TaxID=69181 RepID=A0A8S9N4W3_BRACR|nr:hypothetical protein F2Q69_00039499 [Brassica cretica]
MEFSHETDDEGKRLSNRKLTRKGSYQPLKSHFKQRSWELTAPWDGLQIKVPVKYITGDLDPTYHIPGTKEYIHDGGLKKHVPFLQEVVVMEGVGHFLQQEKPKEITDHIYGFFKKF